MFADMVEFTCLLFCYQSDPSFLCLLYLFIFIIEEIKYIYLKHQFQTFFEQLTNLKALIGESLGRVSVSRLKKTRLSVSSQSRTKFLRLSRLGLVSDENFSDSLVSVWSRLLQFYSVSSRSCPDLYV